jgi:8-amino-7-oxononanoate synthase
MKSQPLNDTMASLLAKRKTHSALRALSTAPPSSIDFSSNDFLSLTTSPLLKTAYLRELESSPAFRLGSGGSRLLDGNSPYAEQLEKEIAAFHGASDGLLFNSGFDANSGFFACVPQPGDLILHDEYIHASVHEGMRLSRAGACVSFAHNSIQDLKTKLKEHIKQDSLIKTGDRNVFVAIESLYSMDGDLAPIVEIVELVESLLPEGNGHIVVDEAHSNGIYGFQGRGIVCNLGLENRIFARLHTFGKGLACNGGKSDGLLIWNEMLTDEAIMLCSPLTREYLINYARSFIYSTAMSFPSLAAIKVVYSLMKQGRTQSVKSLSSPLSTHSFLTFTAHIPPRRTNRTPLLPTQNTSPSREAFTLRHSTPPSPSSHPTVANIRFIDA